MNVLLRLRAMQRVAALAVCSVLFSMLITRLCRPWLSVDNGLLSSSSWGWGVSEWVSVICRVRLFDSLSIWCPLQLERFIMVSNLVICVCWMVPGL